MKTSTDILIIGSGVSGLFTALNLPPDKNILIISKDDIENSDSFLAQGGICVLKNENDYDSYFEDTMKAGHYENNRESVDIMLRSSRDTIEDLIRYGVEFESENGELIYTREGAHSTNRILFHKDITGKEITGKLLTEVKKRDNITIKEHVTMLDLLCRDNICYGIVYGDANGKTGVITADYTVMATGGIGGLYAHSTNFSHLTADGLAVSLKHGIELQNIDYVQIHPTTLYSTRPGRQFLISESVRGEGAFLYNADMERFVDELLPRDLLTAEIYKQMEKDSKPYVWLSMEPIPNEEIKSHFPNIYERCLLEGIDITKDCIPVVPAQHYFMGGIKVDSFSRTSMERLYAVGETSCNGVHGTNRLASNSLLESIIFSKRAAKNIAERYTTIVWDKPGIKDLLTTTDKSVYDDVTRLQEEYKQSVLNEMKRMKNEHAKSNYNEIKC